MFTPLSMAYRIRQGRPFNQPPQGLDYTSTFLYLLDHLNERVRPLCFPPPRTQLIPGLFAGLQAQPRPRQGPRRPLPPPRRSRDERLGGCRPSDWFDARGSLLGCFRWVCCPLRTSSWRSERGCHQDAHLHWESRERPCCTFLLFFPSWERAELMPGAAQFMEKVKRKEVSFFAPCEALSPRSPRSEC